MLRYDLATAVEVRCARDGSLCIAMSFCTAFSPEHGLDFECGWHACESPANRGGAGGDDPNCPVDKVEDAWTGNEDATRPCANDDDCLDGLVCNQRYDNRMFCGEPRAGSGGEGGASPEARRR